jgi:hypothetical protein
MLNTCTYLVATRVTGIIVVVDVLLVAVVMVVIVEATSKGIHASEALEEYFGFRRSRRQLSAAQGPLPLSCIARGLESFASLRKTSPLEAAAMASPQALIMMLSFIAIQAVIRNTDYGHERKSFRTLKTLEISVAGNALCKAPQTERRGRLLTANKLGTRPIPNSRMPVLVYLGILIDDYAIARLR